ncbi:MAG: hypothetical protein KJ792_07005 [Actinobacteria bacterium]|nr:hypothetical protein [Actinomycetota bacterium]MCG2803519.1 hypothetical protein [Cellulomonas sp.]
MPGPASRLFELVAILVAVASIPLALLVWNRVRGPVALRAVQRVLVLLVCQVAAVAAVFAGVNQANRFYVTWDELFGTADLGAATIVPGAAAAAPQPAQAPNTAAPATPTTAAPTVAAVPFTGDGSGLVSAQVTGARSGVNGQILVWTPPGYTATGDPLPVLLALDGSPGDPIDTFNGLQLVAKASELIATGAMKPTLIVSATTNVGGKDWGCSDAPADGPKVATWLTQDVPAVISASFHVLAVSAQRWQVMGYSSGASCAVRLAVTTPALFSAAASLAGANVPDARVLSGSAQARKDNDLRTLVAAGTDRPVALLLAASKQDAATTSDAVQLQKAVGPQVSADLELLTRGGHNWDTWQAMTSPALSWLAQHTNG